ncbi:hypothetical protein BO70DRAFT_362849 [Aspergillus heteromorphus CBS 117.55]|uniref:Uncharacterized protein n=1 Tax=Aspergillus heteromorphus CBS 117.55 TaxID=1448321 RepID=A0A317VZP6_9EURO|nr:uncharacterized protein BO70DRAFT_362849 [Aspergillus heteromorphus CBS 117.55]PWY79713.1 hypothetical protein BO70DRAFT_362849 [Aspergillus heteromorphus CBS 117.55]
MDTLVPPASFFSQEAPQTIPIQTSPPSSLAPQVPVARSTQTAVTYSDSLPRPIVVGELLDSIIVVVEIPKTIPIAVQI